MSCEIGLVVTDLDGTLWDRTGRVHPATLRALAELNTMGVPVLAATARRPATALQVMRANDVLLPAVLFDGSLGRSFDTGVTFHRHCFDPAVAEVVLDGLIAGGIEPCINVEADLRDVVAGEHPSTHPDHLRFIDPWLRREDLRKVVREQPVFSFLVCGLDQQVLLPALSAAQHLATGSVSRDLYYQNYNLSIRPDGVSKWNGVLAFCQANDLDPSAVLAVGDGENDVELLRSAAISCAVGDGCDAVLELAQHRLPPTTEGGWSSILDVLSAAAPSGR